MLFTLRRVSNGLAICVITESITQSVKWVGHLRDHRVDHRVGVIRAHFRHGRSALAAMMRDHDSTSAYMRNTLSTASGYSF
jgi:hypothetical protein